MASIATQAATVRLELPLPNGGLASTALVSAGNGQPERFAGGMGIITTTVGDVVTSVSGGDVVLWDSRTGKISRRLGTHPASVDGLESDRAGQSLVSASSRDGTLQVWDLDTGALRRAWKAEDGALAVSTLGRRPLMVFAPEGNQVAASGATSQRVGSQQVWNSSRLQVWNVAMETEVWSVPNAGVGALAYAPEGGRLIAFTQRVDWVADGNAATGRLSEQALRIWEAGSGTLVVSVPIPGTNVTHLLAPRVGHEILALAGTRSFWFDTDTGRITRRQAFPVSASLRHAHLDDGGRRLLALEFQGDKLHVVDLDQGTSTLLWQAATSLERLSLPSYSSDLSLGVGLRGFTPVVWDVPFPRITGWSTKGSDVQVTTSTVRGGTYQLLRSLSVDGPWAPVARETATAETLMLTDTNALPGALPQRLYRVARD